MKQKIVYLLFLAALLTSSCQNNTNDLEPEPLRAGNANPSTDPDKAFLKELTPDPPSPYYISGEFDGYPINFATKYAEDDNSYNAIYLDSTLNLDNIYLIRDTQGHAAKMALYFMNTKMFTRQFPYTLPHPNLDYCENVQLELMNLAKVGSVGQGSPEDDFSFRGQSGAGLQVQVTSLVNNIIEGNFEGRLNTNTGSSIKVKNGKFRIKLENVKLN